MQSGEDLVAVSMSFSFHSYLSSIKPSKCSSQYNFKISQVGGKFVK